MVAWLEFVWHQGAILFCRTGRHWTGLVWSEWKIAGFLETGGGEGLSGCIPCS